MSLAVLVPVLRRPHRVVPLLESLSLATPEPWTAFFVLDPGDDAEHAAVMRAWQRFANIASIEHEGNYAQKINRAALAAESLGYSHLFLGADDLDFHPGWLEAASAHLSAQVQVVGTNDLCNRRTDGVYGTHSTHTLVARSYIAHGTVDHPGKLLHEGYPHEYVDDEFVETAKWRGMYAHAKDSVVEHLHPMVGKAPMDDLYAAQRTRMRGGRVLYRQRRQLWT